MGGADEQTKSSTETSIILWLKYAVLFFTTFTATTSCVFKFWHFTTCPNVPWPRTSRIRYRFLSYCQHIALIQGRYNILVARLFRSKDVIHVENVVAVLIVIPIVLCSLAGFSKDASGISRRFVFETGIAYSVCRREMGCKCLQGLSGNASV